MKFTINQTDLLPALTQCQAVAERKGTMPVLSNVLLVANGAVKLSATDLYQSVAADTNGKVEQQGDVAVDARALFERVKSLPGEIRFALNGSSLTLKSGSRRFTLQTIPGAEMPRLPDPDGATFLLNIPSDELAQLIGRVEYAISTDETRLHMNSLLLEHEGDKLTAVATDGHRLSIAVAHSGSVGSFKILLPLKGVTQLRKLCESADDVTLRQSGITLFADVGGYRWTSKLTDATPVPYQQVIPSNHTGRTEVDRQALLDACKAVAVAASDRTGGVKLSFTREALRLSSESPEGGDGGDEIACTHDGPEVEIGVNARYLEQALAVIEGEMVEIVVSGELDPLSVKAVGDESGSVAVIMPLRV